MRTNTTSASLFSSAISLATVLIAGCAGDPVTGNMPGGPGGGDGDTEAPQVVDSTPTINEHGVQSDATIQLHFSEPMDRASVESAYASDDLPASGVTFAWNAESTLLEIMPSAPLTYVEGVGNDPTVVEPSLYRLSIGTGATDLAGNPLTDPYDLSFTTRRRMRTTAPLVGELSRSRIGTAGTILSANIDLGIGDTSGDAMQRAFVTFDLAQVPVDIELEAATLSARQLAPSSTPYDLGLLTAYHLHFATFEDTATALPISIPGMFSADAVLETKSVDVANQVADDLLKRAERQNMSQYRLQFDSDTDGDGVIDRAVFAKGTFSLAITYVVD